jgi:predicted translin family RNA/ssDNA-binding protein
MIIVHDIFICKPGQASKMAKLFKEVMTGNEELVNIMTDMTGEFNRVVMVTKYDNLAAYEQNFQKYMQDSDEMKKMKEKMKGYHDMYVAGSREIFHVW